MKWSPAAAVVSALLAPRPAAAYDCADIEADKTKFDFSKLTGPHTIITTQATPPTVRNTTYSVDLCGPLKLHEDVKKGDECADGTWICAIQQSSRGGDDAPRIEEVIPVAGNLQDRGGGALSYTATRLKTAETKTEAAKDGVRLVFHGGAYPLANVPAERVEQRAEIELLCSDMEGTEGELAAPKAERREEGGKEDEGEGEKPPVHHSTEKQLTKGDKEEPALVWNSFDEEKGVRVLRLTWHTKYACAKAADEPDSGDIPRASSGLGFFTWFVILVFMGTAAYLIFGSWLNYTRYGARGWDLLPHGDTIRDVPYLLKDWTRRLINTVQGSGSRGGYSAV